MSESVVNSLSDIEFAEIVSSSYSLTEVTKRCGYRTYKNGSGREKVKNRIKILNLDTSHFKTTGRQFEKSPHNKILNCNEVLKSNSTFCRDTIRSVILREKLIEYKCSICGNEGFWNNQKLSLQLHHKDGNTMNNEINNLVFLCPNCHSQTDNYSSRNSKRIKKKFYCTVCGKQISSYTRTGKCRECAAKARVISKPPLEELLSVVKKIKFKKYICFHYGISDKTLDQWLISYNLPPYISELHKYLEEKIV